MRTFKNILVYVNTERDSHDALPVAERLAQASGAKVKAIAVTPELPVYLREPAWGYPALSDTLERETREKLEAILGAAGPLAKDWTRAVRRGKPDVEIIREVLRGGHDLVIKTAELTGASALFGDTAIGLFRKCPCPVWAVEPGAGDRLKRVAAAVDPFDADQSVLNRRILALAVEAARLGGGQAWAAHVFQPPPLSLPQQIAARADEMRGAVRKRFDALLEPYESTIAPEHRVLLEGEPEKALRQFTQDERIDLLVMGTLVRTGIAGLLIGNTAERVLRNIECSVLAVKPSGFVSPI